MRAKTKSNVRHILLGAGLVLIPAVIVLIYFWNRPLGPSLGWPTLLPEIAALNSNKTPLVIHAYEPGTAPQVTGVAQPEESPAPSIKPIPTQAPGEVPQPMCGGPAVMTILAIGTDYKYDNYTYGLADAIRLVRIDFTNPEVSALDFPRDLWVEIPEIADHGVTHGKLNQGYAFGTTGIGFYDGPGGAAGLLARTMELNFGVRVDHYITINLQTLVDAVDAVGGVDIYFDHVADLNAVVGPEYPSLILTPGVHHVDGTLAKSLVRSRIPTTFQRADYQNMLINALRDKLMTPEMWPQVPLLVARFIDDVQTDLSPNDLNQLLCLAQYISNANTNLLAFPQEMFTSSHTYDPYRRVYTYTLDVDFDYLRALVAQYMAGAWPE